MTHAQLNPATTCRGRPREFDIDAALDKAICVFRQRGYHATSINDVSEATGLTTGSLYKAFNDKQGLFITALDRYICQRKHRVDQVTCSAKSGRAKLQALLDNYVQLSCHDEGQQGCLLISCAVDLAVFAPPIQQRVRDAMAYNESLIRELIGFGIKDQSIPSHINPTITARLIFCLLLGMRVTAKTGQQEQDMAAIAKQAMQLIS